VQLIATAHGNTLDNLLQNPTLSDLIGGIQAVTLSDEEAKRRRTKKTVLERKAPPTFNLLVEIHEKDRLGVHHDVAAVVDAFLRGRPLPAEERVRTREGKVEIQEVELLPGVFPQPERMRISPETKVPAKARPKPLRIFTYGVSRNRLERAIQKFGVPGRMVSEIDKADIILTLKSQRKRQPRQLRKMEEQGVPLHVIRSNTVTQMENFVRTIFDLKESPNEEAALGEAEGAAQKVLLGGEPICGACSTRLRSVTAFPPTAGAGSPIAGWSSILYEKGEYILSPRRSLRTQRKMKWKESKRQTCFERRLLIDSTLRSRRALRLNFCSDIF
jgi:hypothetical protein